MTFLAGVAVGAFTAVLVLWGLLWHKPAPPDPRIERFDMWRELERVDSV